MCDATREHQGRIGAGPRGTSKPKPAMKRKGQPKPVMEREATVQPHHPLPHTKSHNLLPPRTWNDSPQPPPPPQVHSLKGRLQTPGGRASQNHRRGRAQRCVKLCVLCIFVCLYTQHNCRVHAICAGGIGAVAFFAVQAHFQKQQHGARGAWREGLQHLTSP